MNRRLFVRNAAGVLSSLPILTTPAAPAEILAAIDAHRAARSHLDRIERTYALLAPDYDSNPARLADLRRLEGWLEAAFKGVSDTARSLMFALDRAGLSGVVDGPELFAVAEIEPDLRRLVVVPTARIRGL